MTDPGSSTPSLQQRLHGMAEAARRRADQLPPGDERDELLRKVEQAERSAAVEAWISSPGLRPPT